jgi:His/Glu/Gln/Arg/opine family amino acid ABC transporter permease subunit
MVVALYGKALVTTLGITLLTVSFGLIIGTIVAFIRIANRYSRKMKWLSIIATGYAFLFRGTPLVLQLMLLKNLFGANHSAWFITLLGVSFNSGSYVSEIIRGNALTIAYEQYEAAQSLGSTPRHALKSVIFPQALRNSIPSLLNEFSALVKETAVVGGTLGLIDLTCLADNLSKGTANWPYYVSGAIYIIVVFLVTWSVKRLSSRTAVKER